MQYLILMHEAHTLEDLDHDAFFCLYVPIFL